MSRQMLDFFRPTFVAVIAFALLVSVASVLFFGPERDQPFGRSGTPAEQLDRMDVAQVVLPKASFTPEEVVKLQLAGLADSRPNGVGILQCYSFASPANREVTGPLERFGRLVRQEPYAALAHPRAVLVGRPELHDRYARLLVSVIDEHWQVQAFSFVLSRQQDPPFAGCWMTEAVFPAFMPAEEPAEAGPAA
jgi:hypothetical protein